MLNPDHSVWIELIRGVRLAEWRLARMHHTDQPSSSSTGVVWHQPVLVDEVLSFLAPREGQAVVDCTVGSGGHSLAVVPRLLPGGHLIGLDRDAQALEAARQRLVEFQPVVHLLHENFRALPALLQRLDLPAVDGVIADLGMSSLQLEQGTRGFSFSKEGPLDMRMDARQPTTAATLIQHWSEPDLAHVLETYGEEPFARRIAKRIVAARAVSPIQTTTQLARIVADAVPARGGRLHPATKTFMALRIAVNEQFESLKALLAALPTVLKRGGRAAIITFHSLEDRLVKQAFQQSAKAGVVRILTKHVVRPSESERLRNPRSRSAKLRVVERI